MQDSNENVQADSAVEAETNTGSSTTASWDGAERRVATADRRIEDVSYDHENRRTGERRIA